MSSYNERHTAQKLTGSVIAVIVLTVCLCITTYALVTVSVSESGNLFRTGKVEVNLNDGNPVIEEHEFLFEPGMTVTKPFFIENKSTADVYYRIYLEDVTGGLATVLRITVADGDRVLFAGTAAALSKANVGAADDTLLLGEKRNLTISFYYPAEATNATQDQSLTFKLCAEAVQTRNNPDKRFD